LLVAKLRCCHKSCTNAPEFGCSKQFRCAAHNAAHIKDVLAKQLRVIKAKEPSSLDRKPPRAPCLGVPKSEDNPEGDHSTKLLRVVTEVRKGIAKNAAQSKWADKHEVLVSVSPPTELNQQEEDEPPALIPINCSILAQPLPTSQPLAAIPSCALPSPPSIPSQHQFASSPANFAPTTTNSTPMPAGTAADSTPRSAPPPQIPNSNRRVQQQSQPK